MPHKLPFRVVYVSSQDDFYAATELNKHSPSAKGWISARFCTFPQQLILALDEKCKLWKIQILCHQFLIASKVEFCVGYISDGETNHFKNARYTRLGYVALSDNQKTEFKARELKSVHIDASGSFIQMFLHKNHINDLNVYNQVGLIAINIIGEKLRKGVNAYSDEISPLTHKPDYIPPTEDLAFDMYQDPEVAGIIRKLERQKHKAVAAELFDEAQAIRDAIGKLQQIGERLGRLSLEKQQAVEEENYERAKLKKHQIHEIKTSLYRDLDIMKLLAEKSHNNSQEPPVTNDANNERYQIRRIPPIRLQTLQTIEDSHETRSNYEADDNVPSNSTIFHEPLVISHPLIDPDERPLPALKSKLRNNNAINVAEEEENLVVSEQIIEPLIEKRDDNSLPHETDPLSNEEGIDSNEDEETMRILHHSNHDHSRNDAEPELSDVPEPLSETIRRQAVVAIDVVGLEMVTKAYSKSWIFREKALIELKDRVTAPELPVPVAVPDIPTSDPRVELKSTTFLLRRALNDQVLSIFRLATQYIKPTIVDFAEKYSIPKPDLYYAMDKLIPIIFHRTGDTSVRIRNVAKNQILLMAQWPQIKQSTTFWNEVVRPFSPVTLDRLALSQMELVTELYATRGIDLNANDSGHLNQSGFTLESLACFTTQALTHRSNEVREAAENLMVALYRAEDRNVIRRIMPLDDINCLRHPLYRRLFSKFDRIDNKYAPISGTNQGAKSLSKQKEVEALQADVQQIRALVSNEGRTSASRHISPRAVRPSRNRAAPSKSNGRSSDHSKSDSIKHTNSHSPQKRPIIHNNNQGRPDLTADPNQLTEEAELLLSLDKTCIFCGEKSDSFTEEGLDLHYWKSCPMLHRCPNCKQVVEIAGFTEHLLSECESSSSGQYTRCSRCSEAVLKTHLNSHYCVPVSIKSGLRCPLCHLDLPNLPDSVAPGGPEDIWKAHLLGSNQINVSQCTENPRNPRKTQNVPIDSSVRSIHTNPSTNTAKFKSGIPRSSQPVGKVRPV